MKLGIVVISDRHPVQIDGIARAALSKGHTVAIFVTDEGVKLLAERGFTALSALPGVAMIFCEQSARGYGGTPADLPGSVVPGSQFHNAVMNEESDKVIVL